jgi:hypothetical protein
MEIQTSAGVLMWMWLVWRGSLTQPCRVMQLPRQVLVLKAVGEVSVWSVSSVLKVAIQMYGVETAS